MIVSEDVTLKANAERLTEELSPSVLIIYFCRGWDSNTQPSASGRTLEPTAPPPRRVFIMSCLEFLLFFLITFFFSVSFLRMSQRRKHSIFAL